MKTAVITGSSRGIGLGLAQHFLAHNWNVVINGRSESSIIKALKTLESKTQKGSDTILAVVGDATKPEDMQQLWDKAAKKFKAINIWINNAGIGHPLQMAWELPMETVNKVVDIDFKGMIIGSRVAVQGMLKQRFGHVYNMEGFGSTGMMRPGLSIYGASKRALTYFTQSLHLELKKTPVKISAISPGMVVTELITSQYKDDSQGFVSAKKIFNIIADKVETVTPWLVKKMIQNQKSGKRIQWLSGKKIFFRFLTAGFRKRNLFDD